MTTGAADKTPSTAVSVAAVSTLRPALRKAWVSPEVHDQSIAAATAGKMAVSPGETSPTTGFS